MDERSELVTREVLRAELAGIDVKLAKVEARFAGVDAKFAELRSEMHEGFRRQQTWLIATGISIIGVGLTGLGVATTVVVATLSG